MNCNNSSTSYKVAKHNREACIGDSIAIYIPFPGAIDGICDSTPRYIDYKVIAYQRAVLESEDGERLVPLTLYRVRLEETGVETAALVVGNDYSHVWRYADCEHNSGMPMTIADTLRDLPMWKIAKPGWTLELCCNVFEIVDGVTNIHPTDCGCHQ